MKQALIIVFAAFLAGPGVAQETGTTESAAVSVAAPVTAAEAAQDQPPAPETPVAEAEAPTSDTVVTEEIVVIEPEAPVAQVLEVLNAADVSLTDFLWLKRPVVVFADTPADPRFTEQLELLLARPEELIARDVVVLTDTDPDARSEVRLKLRPRGFQLTLIAKDGTVNLRKPAPWDVREITRAIDKWPLRQDEIRTEKAGLGE